MSELWSNWTGDQRCAPARIERPRTERELAAAVRRAAEEGRGPVRAVGAGHSFSDCALTDGVMIDLGRMQRLLSVDRERGLVALEAGIEMHRLGPQLAEHGLALENQGDIDRQSFAGAVSTATHGTGIRFQNLAARVVAMRLVTAAGEVLEVSPERDLDTYLAARVSLGALGVVSALTVQCVPLFTVHRDDRPEPLERTLDRLDEHVDGNDHFEFFVFPYTRTALTRRSRRSDAPPAHPTPRWKRTISEELVQNRALALACGTGRLAPRLVPRINRAIASAMTPAQVEDRAHEVFASTRAVRFTEMEYAIPRAAARPAIEAVLELVERRRLPILFPVEVRFAASDEAFLSTAHGRETCFVAVHQYRGMEYETFFRAVEEIMDGHDGRPHWGKRHYRTEASLRDRYPDWDRFQAVRAALDPDGLFANDHVRRVLGVSARSERG